MGNPERRGVDTIMVPGDLLLDTAIRVDGVERIRGARGDDPGPDYLLSALTISD